MPPKSCASTAIRSGKGEFDLEKDNKLIELKKSGPLRGELSVPGDKSISHRSIMFASLAKGVTEISHFLESDDCLSTISCFRRLGIRIDQSGENVRIEGKGLRGLKAPDATLDAGNSGTTLRLLSGILCGQDFDCVITGDDSLKSRPMKRIMTPLTRMGADITSEKGNDCAPLKIHGKPLHGIHYDSPVASAQVKSCILLAGLYADEMTSVKEPALSRDHSERMLNYFGADVKTDLDPSGAATITIAPLAKLIGQKIIVPGDISSAAYFIAAALLVPGSEVLLKNVGINPTRDGMLRICKEMGADITILNQNQDGPEPCADLLVRSSRLKAVSIGGDIIPTLIDELPVLSVLAAFADGTTVIKDAKELRVKESDRIKLICENLARMGCPVTATKDGMIIEGGKPLHGALIDTQKDHRIAMSFSVAALACSEVTKIKDAGCVSISYPSFYEDLSSLQ